MQKGRERETRQSAPLSSKSLLASCQYSLKGMFARALTSATWLAAYLVHGTRTMHILGLLFEGIGYLCLTCALSTKLQFLPGSRIFPKAVECRKHNGYPQPLAMKSFLADRPCRTQYRGCPCTSRTCMQCSFQMRHWGLCSLGYTCSLEAGESLCQNCQDTAAKGFSLACNSRRRLQQLRQHLPGSRC